MKRRGDKWRGTNIHGRGVEKMREEAVTYESRSLLNSIHIVLHLTHGQSPSPVLPSLRCDCCC